jgi:hypothetical protein
MSNAPPIGQRFSQVYIKRGEPTQDSERMRRRLAALMWDFPDLSEFSSAVPLSLGVDVPYGQFGFVDWPSFFSELRASGRSRYRDGRISLLVGEAEPGPEAI